MKDKKAENTDKTQSKGKRIAKIVFNTIINILIVLVLITSILIAVMSLSSKASGGVSTIFGRTILTVQSDSMKGGSDEYEGGDFEKGDLLIGQAVSSDGAEYQVGDIVSFKATDTEGVEYYNTHRIVDKELNENGVIVYTTKGDNNEIEDPEKISDLNIVSLFRSADFEGTLLKGWGTPLDFIKQPQGFFFVVLLPMIFFFMYAIFRVVLNAVNYKKTKAKEDKEDAEREKQEAVDAAVKAALAAVGKDSDAGDGVPDKDDSGNGGIDAPADSSSVKSPNLTPDQMEQFKQFLAFQESQKAKSDAKPEEPAEDSEAPSED